jgi:RNA-directed DNA polymerase
VTFAQIEAEGLDAWLASLREELVLKMYRPAPVRRVMIPKPGGGERPLGIPTIRDRVAQTAAKLVLGFCQLSRHRPLFRWKRA